MHDLLQTMMKSLFHCDRTVGDDCTAV